MKHLGLLLLLVLPGCSGIGDAPADTPLGQCQQQALNDPAVKEAIERANSTLQEVRVPGVRDQKFAIKQAVQRCMAAKGLAPKGGVEAVKPYW